MNTSMNEITRGKWQSLFDKSTPQERLEITTAILQRIESRERATIEYLKSMPLALEGLRQSDLMDVVEIALSDAFDWIADNHPQAREKLSAYETLSVYYMTQGEKSERDMREVIGAICTTWGVSLFPEPTANPDNP